MNEKRGDIAGTVNAGRMNAKRVIVEKAKRLHRDAEALEAIANSVSWETIRPDVEELLWHYFVSH